MKKPFKQTMLKERNSDFTITPEGKVGGKQNAFGLADRVGTRSKAFAKNRDTAAGAVDDMRQAVDDRTKYAK